MNGHELMDKVVESSGESLPLGLRLRIGVHLLFCPRCAAEAARFEAARKLLRTAAFPPAPALESLIMERIEAASAEDSEIAGEISFRSWVVTGVIIILSLSSAFIGMNARQIAPGDWTAFLLPLGLTVGIFV
ncbi:MAG: peptidoglycan-binding protein, partial [Spirochaetaceae bacterium]|nr:peptidoglycan-binding protein [Spirochaetaceae bacterium]